MAGGRSCKTLQPSAALLAWVLVAASCTITPPAQGPKAGTSVTCPDGSQRVAVACGSFADLRERVYRANLGISQLDLGVDVVYDEKALGQITASTQQLALEMDSKCARYNACAMDAESWSASETELQRHVDLAERLQSSPDAVTANAIWENAVPQAAAQRLRVRFQVQVEHPSGEYSVHDDGAPLFTGDALRFAMLTSRPAHVYIVVIGGDQVPRVIFPNPSHGLDNPLPGNRTELIPPPEVGKFVLDAVTGREHATVLVADHAITELDHLLSTDDPSTVATGQDILRVVGGLICGSAAQNGAIFIDQSRVRCGNRLSRGLELRGPDALQQSTPSSTIIAGASDSILLPLPNEGLVVLQHEIEHLVPPEATAVAREAPEFSTGKDGFLRRDP